MNVRRIVLLTLTGLLLEAPAVVDAARRAQGALKPGSPEWVKADDILNYKPQT